MIVLAIPCGHKKENYKHMKTTLFFLCTILSAAAIAQTSVSKVFPVQPGQKLNLYFDYPELIKLSTWDKNEISIQGTVNINAGENDDEFKIENSVAGNEVMIRGGIPNLKQLPQHISISRGGEKIVFKIKADYQRYVDENGKDFGSTSWGSDVRIVVEIRVPKNMETTITSVYGLIEIKDFSGPLTAEATYGGIDAAMVEKSTGKITAETNYGQIYSNLEIKFSGSEFRDFHTMVSANPGVGPSYNFESKYGNVYLRKRLN